MSDDHSLTPEEVAAILKIKKHTVYQLVKRGELPAFRIGRKLRINPQDIEEYRQRGKSSTNTPVSIAAPPTGSVLSNESMSTVNNDNELIICGLDPILDVLSRHVEGVISPIRVYRKHVGSFSGLLALYQGQAHIAGAHLIDGDSGQYNTPYVRRLLPGIPAVIIHLAYRQQGFYVAKGNPMNLKSWFDLTRSEVRFINREPGCGTRVLLDEKLRQLGIDRHVINGYELIEHSHLAVASAIARDTADVGLGIQKAALQVRGIDFVPLQQEPYEIVIREDVIRLPSVKKIIEIINSDSFKNEVLGLGDYDLSLTGQITARI